MDSLDADQAAAALLHMLTPMTRQAASDLFGAHNGRVGGAVLHLKHCLGPQLEQLLAKAEQRKKAAKEAAKKAAAAAAEARARPRYQAAVDLAVPHLPEGWGSVAASLQFMVAGQLPATPDSVEPEALAAGLLHLLTGQLQRDTRSFFGAGEQQVYAAVACLKAWKADLDVAAAIAMGQHVEAVPPSEQQQQQQAPNPGGRMQGTESAGGSEVKEEGARMPP